MSFEVIIEKYIEILQMISVHGRILILPESVTVNFEHMVMCLHFHREFRDCEDAEELLIFIAFTVAPVTPDNWHR